ncbi:ribonuclease PH [Coriobacteriaceae bacterium]|uniref:Ribonuclease PH n=1 Tax=Granulimonas faecalis TaxID=2894155 RepID=A0AAV5AYU1_9ACTN|nr:ribonuclease PH [Granulimonas faecalis]MBF0599103.1 ribonuclease PH [Atopobiaceae bacterium FL090493]TGY59447.1 ribonuclease PH [Coriobacteriaceae bacterium]GJM54770.1 ribonuclease PH [Granulimonas faecalis]
MTLDAPRHDGRAPGDLRPVTLTRNVMKNALGSCMAEFGDTRVLCAATIEDGVPGWRKASRKGWVTAEYAMLPASTSTRSRRETRSRKGRSMEIERLIGRSLRAVVNMQALGEVTVTVDCDVIQADGGTRTASVTGAWVALHDALAEWVRAGRIPRLPLTGQVAAVSMGVVDGRCLLDLDYSEDSRAEVDMNLVGCADGTLVEVQGTGERIAFDRAQLDALLDLGQGAVARLCDLQTEVTGFRK